MSWASKRRTIYGLGVFLFFAVVIGIPLAIWIYEPPACFDGKQNQGETAVDKGGPCLLLDERALQTHAVLWSRAFPVRGGLYNAVAYIENPNDAAGVRSVRYRFGFYDDQNILVAEREGKAYIMPGGITPVFEGGINTGNRRIARSYFEFTSPLSWERMKNPARVLVISDKVTADTDSVPQLSAKVKNTSVANVFNPSFVAVVFDTAGNAFTSSATTLAGLSAGAQSDIVYTWPDPFPRVASRIDILPLLPPVLDRP